MKRTCLLLLCFVLGTCWSCARPDAKAERVNPLDSVPRKATPLPDEDGPPPPPPAESGEEEGA